MAARFSGAPRLLIEMRGSVAVYGSVGEESFGPRPWFVRTEGAGDEATATSPARVGVVTLNADACLALATANLIQADSQPRLEARAASFLARNSGLTITALRTGLGADAPTHRVLREMLESHPSFVATRAEHWALGSVRTTLAT